MNFKLRRLLKCLEKMERYNTEALELSRDLDIDLDQYLYDLGDVLKKEIENVEKEIHE
jgi:hypothetical protein